VAQDTALVGCAVDTISDLFHGIRDNGRETRTPGIGVVRFKLQHCNVAGRDVTDELLQHVRVTNRERRRGLLLLLFALVGGQELGEALQALWSWV